MSIWWWRYDKVRLVTAIRPEECLARLRASTESEWSLFGNNPVVASIGDSSFRIRKRRSPKIQTVLYGRLVVDQNGTQIECRIGVEHVVVGLASIWSLLAVLLCLNMIFTGQVEFSFDGIVSNLGPVILGGLTITLGALIARLLWNDDAFLLDFLRMTLAAQETPTEDSSNQGSVIRQ
jgi:hypothetical protein